MAPRGRGRGRGGGGRGGGRGGRGGRGRHFVSRSRVSDETPALAETFDGDYTALLSGPASFGAHAEAQEGNKFRYLGALEELASRGLDVPQANRVRGLAAAWARKDWDLSDRLLSRPDSFGVVEVLKALSLLDSARSARAVEKRAAALKEATKTAGPKGKSRIGRKLVALKKDAHNLGKEKPPLGSASGALARHIRRWTRGLSADKLEFYALHLPRQTWQELSDKTHLNPEKDFPQLPWFLRFCYDPSKAPPDSLAARCAGLSPDNVNERLGEGLQVPYAHLKQFADSLSEDSKRRVAEYSPDLDTLLWHYEDLGCGPVDAVICRRLDAGESVGLGYGKLVERLLYLQKRRLSGGSEAAPFLERLMPLAEAKLGATKLELESPVVVIGDASASMSVAIETSTIIASFLRAVTGAELVFFSSDIVHPPFQPESIAQVIQLALETKTIASTNHASALLPYYKEKKIVKTFILTTDEEENCSVTHEGHSYRFLELFKKYHAEVYPAKLVFVSFLSSQHAKGQMVPPLEAAGFSVRQFKLDSNRPDLTKLDNMIGQLSVNKSEDLDAIETRLRSEALSADLSNLQS